VLLALTEEGRGEEPGPILPWFLFERIAALIPGDNVCFADLNFVQLRGEQHQGILGGSQRWVDVGSGDNATQEMFWTSKRSFWAPAPPANLGRVRRWSDYYSQNELREQPLYAEFFGPLGVKHFMPSGFRHRRAIPGRCCPSGTAARNFTDRNMLLLQLLRPHLYELDLDSERRRQGVPRLTPREWQVLTLVAQGYGNADIARLLFTSTSTVRKHMEHIFDQTGVRTRTAAVARMLPAARKFAAIPEQG
jgi:DNA-binding CsgD family transcriptional regulator